MDAIINKPPYNINKDFDVWIDRQQRPTIGVIAKVGETRQQVGNDTYVRMLRTLIDACLIKLVPDHLADAYIVYAVGRWKRSTRFHVKVHLPTSVFLSLTGKFCEGTNPLAKIESELIIREQSYNYRAGVLREVFHQLLLQDENRTDWMTQGKFRVATAKLLHYPLVCLYQTDGKTTTTSISTEELPEALGILEKFIREEWKSDGYHVGMVLSPRSSSVYQVAAIVDETEFAQRVGKDVEEVNWNWQEAQRKYI